MIGPVSLDHNIDYQGNERKEVGGAVVASGFAAAKSGNRTAVFTKLNPADADVEERFAGSGADVYWKPSQATCSIRNQYFTADKEKRACTSMGVCDPFRFDELPDIETKIYHFAGLVYGDFDGALFAEAARHGKVAVDVQCLLRHVEADRTMAFHDWAEKKQYLPVIDYLKTDAAEAEILTGLTDRAEAAQAPAQLGRQGGPHHPQHRGAGLRRGDHLHLSHQGTGTSPGRSRGGGDTTFCRLYHGAPAGRGGGGSAVLHGPGLPEDETPGPFQAPTGCAGLYPGVLLRRHRSRPQTADGSCTKTPLTMGIVRDKVTSVNYIKANEVPRETAQACRRSETLRCPGTG